MADKETLKQELEDLGAQLRPQYKRDEARVTGEGRPFDVLGWLAGKPDTHKYPGGPVFLPLGANPTWSNAARNISIQDLTATGLGAAAFYAMGYANAVKVGVPNGHRLGFWMAVPAVIIGLSAGVHRGFYRYLGFTANGNPPIYPGYKEDAAPYFMKHSVSDRRFPVSPDAQVGSRGSNTLQ